MSIYRVIKDKENPYVMVNKNWINNPKMSAKAKGILLYLLSKPNDWKVYENELIKNFSDGRDSIRSGIKELIKHGHLFRYKNRTDDGKLNGYNYDVYEIPTIDGKSNNGLSNNGKSNTTNNNLTDNEINNKVLKGIISSEDNSVFDSLRVIKHFLYKFEIKMNHQHPIYSKATWSFIISNLETVYDENCRKDFDLDEESLIDMIDRYFEIKFKNCDYHMLHFMSSGVKRNRMYEVVY
ncbi:MAG: hypothetical protein ACFFDF_00285 [Candidatus Odinarchaeota archaeon]